MNLRNTQPKQLKDNSKDIRFQINDLQCYNETLDDSDLDEYEDNSKYVMNIFGIDEFGASAPAKDVFNKFGLTPKNISSKIMKRIKK